MQRLPATFTLLFLSLLIHLLTAPSPAECLPPIRLRPVFFLPRPLLSCSIISPPSSICFRPAASAFSSKLPLCRPCSCAQLAASTRCCASFYVFVHKNDFLSPLVIVPATVILALCLLVPQVCCSPLPRVSHAFEQRLLQLAQRSASHVCEHAVRAPVGAEPSRR